MSSETDDFIAIVIGECQNGREQRYLLIFGAFYM